MLDHRLKGVRMDHFEIQPFQIAEVEIWYPRLAIYSQDFNQDSQDYSQDF
jgi:hypothetical protein